MLRCTAEAHRYDLGLIRYLENLKSEEHINVSQSRLREGMTGGQSCELKDISEYLESQPA